MDSGTQVSSIEGRRDISGGRLSTDAVTADNSARSKYFTSLAYTADGSCVLAGGRSKYTCIYAVETGVLVKKFQLSYNRYTDGDGSAIEIDGVGVGGMDYPDCCYWNGCCCRSST